MITYTEYLQKQNSQQGLDSLIEFIETEKYNILGATYSDLKVPDSLVSQYESWYEKEMENIIRK